MTTFLDLASPPFLARVRAGKLAFIASGHPFASYIDARWMHFPRIDTSGGNVAHAAVSLARDLGARKITLHGADFSYPGGKPYSRGTDSCTISSTPRRTAFPPRRAERFVHLPFPRREEGTCRGRRASTPPPFWTSITRACAGRFRASMRRWWPPPVNGLELPPGPAGTHTVRHGESRAFLSPMRMAGVPLRICGGAERPRLIRDPVGSRFHQLDGPQRRLWETLLPIAAQVIAETGQSMVGAPSLAEARRWALQRIFQALSPPEPSPSA